MSSSPTRRRRWLVSASLAVGALLASGLAVYEAGPGGQSAAAAECATTPGADPSDCTATPIKHVVVIFDENESFDHYFGTYPFAANGPGETDFTPSPDTPTGIDTELNAGLLPANILSAHNPNANPDVPNAITRDPNAKSTASAPNPNTTQPSRMDQTTPIPGGNSHDYGDEQTRVDNGSMDQFQSNPVKYYDGNTVTALWNYAQNFAMSDNSWDATFGPSTPGALSLISGQTYISPSKGTMTGDIDAYFDDCGGNGVDGQNGAMSGANIGDLLTAANVTWGWFGGGFKATTVYNGSSVTKSACGETYPRIGATGSSAGYSSHHTPFEYYLSTSNEHHYPGTPGVAIGANDAPNDTTHTGANHEYDTSDFDAAVKADALPAVSFIKPPVPYDAHPSNSGPVDEGSYLVKTINEIEQSPAWSSTAIVIAYDDSDGWYDHVAPTVLNGSTTSSDQAICTNAAAAHPPVNGLQGRCGPSQRLPLLVISPYAKHDYVDHTLTTQPSIIKFVEDNWLQGERIDSFMQAHGSASPYDSPNGPVSYTSDALGSQDATAGDLTGMFDFSHPAGWTAILNPVTYNLSTHVCDCGTVDVAVPKPVITVGASSITTTAGQEPSPSQLTSLIAPQVTHGTLAIDTSAVDFDTPGSYTAEVTASDYSITADPVDVTVTVQSSGDPSGGPSTTPPATPELSVATSSVDVPASHQRMSGDALVTRVGATLNVPGTVTADVTGVAWDVPGTYHVQISGAPTSGQSVAPVTVTVRVVPAPTATTLTVSTRHQAYGAQRGLPIVATVTGGDGDPTGRVRFTVDGRTVATTPLLGATALVRLPSTLAVGTHKVAAAYVPGERASAASTGGPVAISVTKGASTTSLKVSPTRLRRGAKATVTIRVAGATTGSVKLYDGSRVVRTVRLVGGRATVRLGWAKAGKHHLSVRYAGNADLRPSRSKTVTVTVRR